MSRLKIESVRIFMVIMVPEISFYTILVLSVNNNWKHLGPSCSKLTMSLVNISLKLWGVVGWCEGAVYLTSLGRPTDIGLQLGKACYPCSG